MDTATSVVDTNQIVHLLGTLYNSRNAEEQAEANRRLTEFQSTQEAWQICWPLLDPSQNLATEARFFAAQTLFHKINNCWSQQDPEWLENHLRPKLFETLVTYASLPNPEKIVIDRMSLTLATFALHSMPTFWPDAIENILQTFTPQSLPVNMPPQRICEILLKILMFLPEEYSTHMPKLEYRAELNSKMNKSGPIVFKFLHSLLIAKNEAIDTECRQNLLKCLTSWTLHSGTSVLEMDDGTILLDQLYSLIGDEELCSLACSALAATLSSQKAENYRNSIMDFIPKIAELRQMIEKYKMEDNLECVIKIYSLVINFSEHHSRLFLRIALNDGVELSKEKEQLVKQGVFTIIEIILESTSAPGIFGIDEKYSELSFTFWFKFFENFYYYSDSYNDKICQIFNPLVDSLLQILMTKSQFPPSKIYYQGWNDDQREAHRCYRQDLGDNISVIVQFPRARERILGQLYDHLTKEISNLLHGELVGGEKPWQRFESIVFALKSISEAVPYNESTYVAKVLGILAQIPYDETHTILYCTVSEMISAYSDWLYSHPEHLPEAYNILFLGISSPNAHVRLMSTLTVKDITFECQSILRPYAANIVKSCTEAVLRANSSLVTKEKSRLMHAIGTSLAVSGEDMIISSLNTLTTPLMHDLAAKVQCDPNNDPTCRAIIFDRMSMLNSLIESLYVKRTSGTDYEEGDENDSRFADPSGHEFPTEVDITQPSLELLQKLMPILNLIASKYKTDEEIIEIISNTIKRAGKSLGVDIKPVLRDLMMLIVITYDPLVDSEVLEGSLPLYALFKADRTLSDLFMESFRLISEKTLKVCLEMPLRSISFVIKNYFEYATRVCKRFPAFLADQNNIINSEYIYKLAITSLELPEKRTLTEVCNFLCLFRQASIGVEYLERIFVDNLYALLKKLFCIFGGNYSTPRNAIENVTDLLYTVFESEHSQEPLKLIVEEDNFPTNFVNRDQKARFISKIVHEKNRRKFKDACMEFVLVVRNLSRPT